MEPLPAEYFDTTYSAGDLYIRVGQCHPEVDARLVRHNLTTWAYLTAWNPAGRHLSLAENERRNQSLRQRLEQVLPLPFILEGRGVSNTSSYFEASFLVLGLNPEAAIALAVESGQNAIVVGQIGGVARLLDCRAA